jgi:hypothetical protein
MISEVSASAKAFSLLHEPFSSKLAFVGKIGKWSSGQINLSLPDRVVDPDPAGTESISKLRSGCVINFGYGSKFSFVSNYRVPDKKHNKCR